MIRLLLDAIAALPPALVGFALAFAGVAVGFLLVLLAASVF